MGCGREEAGEGVGLGRGVRGARGARGGGMGRRWKFEWVRCGRKDEGCDMGWVEVEFGRAEGRRWSWDVEERGEGSFAGSVEV
jgi:hypothetical protein